MRHTTRVFWLLIIKVIWVKVRVTVVALTLTPVTLITDLDLDIVKVYLQWRI